MSFEAPGGAVAPSERDPQDPVSEEPEVEDPQEEPQEDPADGPEPRTPPLTGAPQTAPVGPTTPTSRARTRGKRARDASTWETWWELNRVEFLPRRFVRPEITSNKGTLVRTGPEQLSPERVEAKLWPELLKLTGHSSTFLRETALISLSRTAANEAQHAQARTILHKALGSADRIVARSAALGLFHVADETSLLPMYQAAASEKIDVDVRVFLALTLATLDHPMAVGLLQQLIDTQNGDYELVSAALLALGHVGSAREDESIPSLLRDIATARDGVRSEHRALALGSLGRIGSLKSLPALLKGLQDRDTHVRRSAAIAVGVLDYRCEAEREIARIRAPYREYVGVRLRDTDRVRIAALRDMVGPQRLEIAKDAQRAVKQLGRTMTRDRDAFVRRMAAISLGRIHAQTRQPLALRHLHAAIKKDRVGMREFALLALAISNGDRAQELALEKLKHRNPSTRGAACIALGLIANKDRGAHAIREHDRTTCDSALRRVMAHDRNPVIRGYAALATGIVGNRSAAADILAMVRATKSPTPRGYGALGMALLGTKQGVDDIVEILQSRDVRSPFVASHLVYAIGLTKDRRPATLDTLIDKAAHSDDTQVQAASIAALGYVSSGEFYPRRHLMARGYNYMLGLGFIDKYFYKL